MTLLVVATVLVVAAVLGRLIAVVRRDEVRHVPRSHRAEPASAHDRWEHVAG